jgi:hypothetical protein
MAEVLHIFYPKLVDLHNYEQGLRVDTKVYNWNTLNQKIFKKIGVPLDAAKITAIANAQSGAIEPIILQLRDVVTRQSTPAPPRTAPEPKKEKEVPAPAVKPMTDEDRELLVAQIIESEKESELIRALEAKEAKLMELMRVKDAKIMKLMAKREVGK